MSTPLLKLLLVFLCVSACPKPSINQKEIGLIAKKELILSNSFTIKKINDSASGTIIFLISDGENKYIAKFIGKTSTNEIASSEMASTLGFGPKVFYSDPKKGLLIMEYLHGPITLQDLESDEFYLALGTLIKTIHQSPPFASSVDHFRKISLRMERAKAKFPTLPLNFVEHNYTLIHQALEKHLELVFSHSDLHAHNLRYCLGKCKALDFADAQENDLFCDIATALLSTDYLANSSHEKILLTSYFGRDLNSIECAKLTLTKELICIKWLLDALDRIAALCDDDLIKLNSLCEIPLNELLRELVEGKFDLKNREKNLQLIKAFLTEISHNGSSEEFKEALLLLNY